MRFKEMGQRGTIINVDIDRIVPDPDQPRKEFDEFYIEGLGNSLLLGQIHPVFVKVIENDMLMLVSGENRWRAAKLKGIKTLQAKQYVPDKDKSPEEQEKELMFFKLAANNQKPLTEKEFCSYVKHMVSKGCTITEIAQNTGYKLSRIRALVEVSNAPEEVQEAAENNLISETAARKLSKAPEDTRKAIIDKAKSGGKKVKVSEVEKETLGRSSLITATSVEKLIAYSIDKVKSGRTEKEYDEADLWDFGVKILQCVLGKENIESI